MDAVYRDPAQWANLLIALASVPFIVMQMQQKRRALWWGIPVLLWMLHTVVYYVIVLIVVGLPLIPVTGALHDWSPVLRLHGYSTILSVEIIRWWYHRKKRRGE
jgi:hypothetical protein